jgi:hypothetical protein
MEFGYLAIINEYAPTVRTHQTGSHIERSGLSRAVRAQKTYNLSLFYIERYIVHNSAFSILLYKILGTQDRRPLLAKARKFIFHNKSQITLSSCEDNSFLPFKQKKCHISLNIVIFINTVGKQKIVPLQRVINLYTKDDTF